MKKYIAILRGINVGGKRKILMADLKKTCAALGFKNVQTYIQSGNVIFDAAEEPANALSQRLEHAVLQDYGFNVPVLIRSVNELKNLYQENPFLNLADADLNALHLTFLSEKPKPEALKKINNQDYGPDFFELCENHVYLKIPGKYHESKLSNAFFEKKLRVTATTRNWKTLTKLIELAENEYI